MIISYSIKAFALKSFPALKVSENMVCMVRVSPKDGAWIVRVRAGEILCYAHKLDFQQEWQILS